jgi:hypothetical protein
VLFDDIIVYDIISYDAVNGVRRTDDGDNIIERSRNRYHKDVARGVFDDFIQRRDEILFDSGHVRRLVLKNDFYCPRD